MNGRFPVEKMNELKRFLERALREKHLEDIKSKSFFSGGTFREDSDILGRTLIEVAPQQPDQIKVYYLHKLNPRIINVSGTPPEPHIVKGPRVHYEETRTYRITIVNEKGVEKVVLI